MSMEEKLSGYRQYWDRQNTRALVGYCPGNYFVSKRYEAAVEFLRSPRTVTPGMILPEAFMPDYERIYKEYDAVNDQTIFTAVPFIGLPWIEAMSGCGVLSTHDSFVSEPPADGFEQGVLMDRLNREWLELYLRFTELLAAAGDGRFPVGQPILRGPCDLLGALFGQKEMIYLFYDEPERVQEILDSYADFFLHVTALQKQRVRPFFGGQAIGFYDLWCPGECVWFQDDLVSLLSPALYDEFVYHVHCRLAEAYPYSLVHMHPASFHVLDRIIGMPSLTCVQVNKDIGGPSVKDMLPALKKIQAVKNLLVTGDFTPEELELLHSEVPPQGVMYLRLDSPD